MAADQAAEPEGPPGRRDVQRNRAKLIAAARQIFDERGIDVPLDEIAHRAGVGHGTLYRHFPTRQAIVEALFGERLNEFLAVCHAALDQDDGWSCLVALLTDVLELQAEDRVLREAFMRYPPEENHLAGASEQIQTAFARVLDRAHRDKALRPDFGLSDLMVLFWSTAGVIDITAQVAPDAWRRHLHFVLDGLRPPAATPPHDPGLDQRTLANVMERMRKQHLGRRRADGAAQP